MRVRGQFSARAYCPSGRALRIPREDFHATQLQCIEGRTRQGEARSSPVLQKSTRASWFGKRDGIALLGAIASALALTERSIDFQSLHFKSRSYPNPGRRAQLPTGVHAGDEAF